MKVAVAVDGSEVASHFGRCDGYVVAHVDHGRFDVVGMVASPGHEPGRLPTLMKGLEVACIVAGGFGPMAIQLLEGYGISTVAGASGPTDSALARLARGELDGGNSTCHH